MEKIILENSLCRLTVGANALVESLIIKATGEECLRQDEDIALFSVTQERPYNNEVKLAHPNKRTTFQANALRREGDKLIVGFEITPFEAVVKVTEAEKYLAFELVDFLVDPEDYGHLAFTPPPVAEFRLVQLPIKNRKYFGEWLNVSWDESAAVNVLATSPYARIESERRKGYRVMTADAVNGIKLRGCAAAVIAAPGGDALMDAIDAMEEDYGLPHGVRSRRNQPTINSSAYWSSGVTPQTVDKHIKYAKQGGFRMMLIYYPAIFKSYGYSLCGDYDYRDEYPNGQADVKAMLDKIKAAGITPGLHFLQTHIGRKSRYMTGSVDHRINLTKYFTLAKPVGMDDTTIYVEQNPENTVMHEKCRVLNFGGECIGYESYSTEYPYCFVGCTRGANETDVREHPAGQIGGIIDVSEFGATSVYIDQNSDLQDEVAEKLADAYNAGFEYIYFDGSEGANVPHGFHVPNAQYRVIKKLNKEPLYTEGAAKAHFSWHFLSGGNAFDVFPPRIFKAMIDKFPAEEAPRMRQDFTRLNFGWWSYNVPDMQPDMYEYGTSRAAAWDCPITIQMNLASLDAHPRTEDMLEVMRRWEDVRAKQWLTDEQKEELKKLGTENEHILLINEDGEYELAHYTEIKCADDDAAAFVFERKGLRYVVFWHKKGAGRLALDVRAGDIRLEKQLGGSTVAATMENGKTVIPIESRCYLKTKLSREEIVAAFENSKLL